MAPRPLVEELKAISLRYCGACLVARALKSMGARELPEKITDGRKK